MSLRHASMQISMLLLCLCVTVRTEYKDYRDYALWRISIPNYDVGLVNVLEEQEEVLVISEVSAASTLDVLVPSSVKNPFNKKLNQLGLSYKVTNTNIHKQIKEQKVTPEGSGFTFSAYHGYEDIMQHLEKLSTDCSEDCSLLTIGQSYENRALKVIKIGTGNIAIWIDGGVHAREWISPATAMFIAHKLIKQGRKKKLFKSFTWYIMPLLNPDGYEYSRSSDRFWRKSRSQHAGMYPYFGVDINRNWNYQWMVVGASSYPNSQIYAGPSPHSEPEVEAVSEFLLNTPNLELYFSLHSYGQMFLPVWGYSSTPPTDIDDLNGLAEKAVNAIQKSTQKVYRIGSSAALLSKVGGTSKDWARGMGGIKYSYTVELRDTGETGFLLPASQIKSTGKEMYRAVWAAAKFIKQNRK